MTISDIVDNFNTTPFLFIGSGISRRYLNTPDWRGLLEHFAKEVNADEFAYSAYENQAKSMDNPTGLLPKVAELIQHDYEEKWYKQPSIRTLNIEQLSRVKAGLSPFKAELAAYIKRIGQEQPAAKAEIEELVKISERSIAGIITTNYDTFLEDHFIGYTKYVGQNQLIFSAIQGVAEIYKIHGSVEEPDSIVINEKDYLSFEEKKAYLAAKLMTIFMEYPIIFLGYSISDSNIQEIIRSIVNCLDTEQVKKLEDRFVFVEYKENFAGVEAAPYTIMIDDKPLQMKKVTLSDFSILYKAMANKKAKLPVRLLRRFKQELYQYTITNIPTAKLRVASIEDTRVADEDMVLAIGKADTFGLRGLSGISANEWYRNIILEDLEFTSDELLEYAFPKLIKENSGMLPVNKYLSTAKGDFPEARKVAEKYNFDNIISNTIKKSRACVSQYTSVSQIWSQEKPNLERFTRLIAYLKENQIRTDELEIVLRDLFEKDINILQNSPAAVKTNIRRLIRIYDYLKWQKKEPLD